jgi:hypothetical protein
MDLTDIYRIFHLTVVEYIVFSTVHGTVSKVKIILAIKQVLTNMKT